MTATGKPIKPIKYLVSGWLVVPNADGEEVYKPFKKLIDEECLARQYFAMMACRNSPCMHTKVDSIECIWCAD